MKFKTRVIEIEAWKWDCGEPMPEWVEKNYESYAKIIFIHNVEWTDVDLNNWLIYDEDDGICLCSDTVFQKKYERV